MNELTKEVTGGGMVGEKVWICHYLRPDLDKKPLRNLPPTECIVFSNDDLPKNKRVYYSSCHYRPAGKDGKAKSKVISPVDNTGFRSRSGNLLFTFNDKQDCIDSWNKQIEEAETRFKEHFEFKRLQLKSEIQKLKDMRVSK